MIIPLEAFPLSLTLCSPGILPPQQCPGIYDNYGKCGFREDHAINVYSSPDLKHWTFETELAPSGSRPVGIYFRPKVLYNPRSKEFVLWVNYLAPASSPLRAYPKAVFLVFTSQSPLGPFKLESGPTGAEVAHTGGGDFTLFQDDEQNTAYLAYDAWSNSHQVVIEQLDDSYYNAAVPGNHGTSLPEEQGGTDRFPPQGLLLPPLRPHVLLLQDRSRLRGLCRNPPARAMERDRDRAQPDAAWVLGGSEH